MELSYILQACVTVALAAVAGGVVGWAGKGLTSMVRTSLAHEGGGHVLRGFHHASR
jgi:hypothetical protein